MRTCTLKLRQERRIRWQYGLTEAQARTIAALHYRGDK